MDIDIAKEIACEGVCHILVWKLGVSPCEIYADSALRADLGLDFVDMEDLGAAVMEKFKIDLSETTHALTSDISVGNFVNFIAEHLCRPAASGSK